MVAALLADTGRLIESEMEVRSVVGMLDRWAAQAPGLLRPPEPRATSVPGVRIAGAATPYPLVGVISPWNFPLLLGLIDAIPALAAGCAVLVKPSEVTPASSPRSPGPCERYRNSTPCSPSSRGR